MLKLKKKLGRLSRSGWSKATSSIMRLRSTTGVKCGQFARHYMRNLLLYTAGVFLLVGLVLIVLSWFCSDQFSQGLLLNLGTEFIGGVLLSTIFWLIDFRPRRTRGISYPDLAARFSHAKDEVRILTTFSYLFAEDTPEEGLDGAQIEESRQALLKRIKSHRSMTVQILILNPNSEAASRRQNERPDVNIRNLLDGNIAFLSQLKSSGEYPNLEVKIYSVLPRIALIQVDDYMSISFFERGVSISRTERYEVSTATPMARFFESSFDSIWKDSETVPLSAYQSK